MKRRIALGILFIPILMLVAIWSDVSPFSSAQETTEIATGQGDNSYPEFIGIEGLSKKLEALSGVEGNDEQGRVRIALLNQLSSLWREKDASKADAYNDEALVLAEALKDDLGIAEAKLQKAYGLISRGRYGDGVVLLDEVYSALSSNASEWLLLTHEATAKGEEVYLTSDISKVLGTPPKGYHFEDGSFSEINLHWAVVLGQYKNAYGLVWSHLGDSARAQRAYEEAYSVYKAVNFPRGVAQSLHNLAVVYTELGGYDRAVKLDLDALRVFEVLGYVDEIADVASNLALINQGIGSNEAALEYLSKALSAYEAVGDQRGQAIVKGRLGQFFAQMGLPEEAMASFQEALETFKSTGDYMSQADIQLQMGRLFEITEEYDKAIKAYQVARDLYLAQSEEIEATGVEVAQSAREGLVVAANNRGTVYYTLGEYGEALAAHLEAYTQAEYLAYREGLSSALLNLSQDYTALEKYKEANEAYELYVALKDYMQEEAVMEKTQQQQVLYDTEKKEKALVAEQAAKAEESAKRKRWVAIAAVTGAMLAVISFLLVLVARERKRSEKLLLNILPKKVASDLKKHGKSPSERFNDVTVYFSDVVNFTTASSTMDPEVLISELNDVFTLFDNIMEAHGCERIKTIGDAYMAVCGMPVPKEDHALRMLSAATEIREALKARNAKSEYQWEIRIGLHSGNVVGGIVGVKKYIYDVFGDAINTASRMESNSVPMAINMSASTYELVHGAPGYTFTEREAILVKGKGEMKMYFAQ